MKTSVILGSGSYLSVSFDPVHDFGRGGWWARLQEDQGSVFTTVAEAKRKRSYEAIMVVASPHIPGWELTREQVTTLGDDCDVLDQNKNWVLSLTKQNLVWETKVEDGQADRTIGMNAGKDLVEAVIRSLNAAVASLARFI